MLNAIAKLVRIFWGPDPESCREMLKGIFLKPFEALEPLLQGDFPGNLSKLKSGLARFRDAKALFEHLEATYVGLFINNRTADIIPLYASCHAGGQADGANAALMGPAAMEMKKRLADRGLSLGADINDPPDHLSIELEYLYFLLENGWYGKDRKSLAEAAAFAGDVMLPWVSALQSRIANEKNYWFYPQITSILVAMLTYLGCQKPIPRSFT